MSPERLTLRAPGKLNLFLEVLGKRPDGYHELRTVMVPVSLFDELTLRRRRRGSRVTFDPPLAGPNTVERAVALARRAAGWRGGVQIHVRKRIPLGAGMGGGSADGAMALVGLDRLLRLGLDRSALGALAARIGSDVPFFLAGGPALCAGRGERVTPLKIDRAWRFTIVHPPFACSTAEIYRRLKLARGPRRRVDPFLRSLARGRLRPFNRLEATAFALYPALRRLRRALGPGACMTGSGSALFVPGRPRLRLRPDSAKIHRVRLLRTFDPWDE
jgi:4-diphosphocytidyl-2-C-methyl-D-erythritol kinase